MADVAHLALADEVVERGEGLLDRRQRVGRVQLVEVDPVGLQPAERSLDRQPDVASASPCAPQAGSGDVRLAWPNFVASTTSSRRPRERLAQERLAEAVLAAVDVGRVDEVDAGVERGVHDRVGALLALGRGARPAEVVAAEADGGDAEAGAAEGAVVEIASSAPAYSQAGGASDPGALVLPSRRGRDASPMSDSRESMSDAAATLEA